MSKSIKIVKEYPFSKVGLNEVVGLKDAMTQVLIPVIDSLKNLIYWQDKIEFTSSEYTARDGFIPYASNCGGLELTLIIPKCEEYDFGFLEFGDCEECQNTTKLDRDGCTERCGYKGQDCSSESEGCLDAKLRIWLKFEGIDGGIMGFYLVMSGGNGDAPYFREKYSSTYFESEFTAKSIAEFKIKAKQHIAKLLKVMA